ncbi:hypothetical protein PYCCODRAFT_55717 [Trametes coccinea BRFM310]|uniref:Uncharacterized protein n=1 Tax=Trametes coccinea (strain BRFM310) TaxID=1353009 RepID=A0A1Y2J5U9_TRAC3|nr:hypothetical protein PYCCODRAFT_55717 [Trametes coccinea BRFM310]
MFQWHRQSLSPSYAYPLSASALTLLQRFSQLAGMLTSCRMFFLLGSTCRFPRTGAFASGRNIKSGVYGRAQIVNSHDVSHGASTHMLLAEAAPHTMFDNECSMIGWGHHRQPSSLLSL